MTLLDDCTGALSVLEVGMRQLGLSLSDLQRSGFVTYCALLLEANAQFNLTAVRESAGVMRTLFLDSLTLLPVLSAELRVSEIARVRAVDIGSGSGMPGLPLAIMHPSWSMVLVESIGKKARFLQETAALLHLDGVSVVARRAEEAIGEVHGREGSDLCVARAVAALPTLLELCAPYVRLDGTIALPKSGDVLGEVRSAGPAARALGLELSRMYPVPESLGLGDGRATVVYRKVRRTPGEYPRRIGLARSRPIGTTAK